MKLLFSPRWMFITSLLVILTMPVFAQAQQGPGVAFFDYECGSASIKFFMHGTAILQVAFSEIIDPLSTALSTNQNQPIKSSGEVALWALHSDELQLHQIKDPDLTRYVLPATICGPLYASSTTSAQALAIVQIDGSGQGIAYAQVSANGQVTAFATVNGQGSALAAAQSNTASSASLPATTQGKYHIVARGENLFRIALHYGTTVTVLARMNSISDPTRIYVGQKIYLP